MSYRQPTKPTFGQTVKEGLGLGLGSAIGHRVVGAVLGPPTIQTQVQAPAQKPDDLWQRCLERTNFDVEKCEVFKPSRP
jgi:hypothetical protein